MLIIRRVPKLPWDSHQNLYWDFYCLTSDLENWVNNVGAKFADNGKLGLTKLRQLKLEQNTRKNGVSPDNEWDNDKTTSESQQKLMQLGTLILAVLFGDWPSRKLLTNYLGYCKSECLKPVPSSTHPPPHFCQCKKAPHFLFDDRWFVRVFFTFPVFHRPGSECRKNN